MISRTGLDVEAQILDGGGMANMGGRGGWRSSGLDLASAATSIAEPRDREELSQPVVGDNGSRGGIRHPTPLRASST
jgi:serine/threonine kinase 32